MGNQDITLPQIIFSLTIVSKFFFFFHVFCFLINYEVFSVFLMHFSHPFKFASNAKADNFSSFSREQKWQEVIITHWLYPVLQTPYLKLHALNLT